jgi:type II secretory pathway pseudopilin PulG
MTKRLQQSDAGFSIIETVIALAILAGGLLTLAAVIVAGTKAIQGSSPAVIAREKAREAIESVHTARDTQVLTWAEIQNAPTGAFLTGPQQLRLPGNDGLVNTADDGAVETQRRGGPDGILGNTDDETFRLDAYTREIEITPVMTPAGVPDPNLRQVRVIVRYWVVDAWRTYTLTTYVSAIA